MVMINGHSDNLKYYDCLNILSFDEDCLTPYITNVVAGCFFILFCLIM